MGLVSPMKSLFSTILGMGMWFLGIQFALAQTWTQTSAPTNNWWSVASSANGSKLVAVANGGGIYTSSDSGNTWVPNNNAPSTNWTSVASSADGSKLVAVDGGGGIYTSGDSGNTWGSNNVPANGWFSVASSADGSKAVVAGGTLNSSVIYTSSDSGNTWVSNNVPYLEACAAAASLADGSKLFVAGQWGVLGGFEQGILVSTNSGSNWVEELGRDFLSLACSSDATTLIAAAGKFILISTNLGATGKLLTPSFPMYPFWRSVASSADGTKLVAAARPQPGFDPPVIYTSMDSGNTWISNNVPTNNWSSVASSADGGKLVAVATGGGIWTLQTTPTPNLNIAPASNNLLLSWVIPSTNFVLEQNSDLTTTNWTDVTNTPVLNIANLHDEVTLPLTGSNSFYRLANQ